MVQAGLFVRGENSPLVVTHMKTTVNIVDVCAEVVFAQTFYNDSENPLEGVYKLELPKEAAISEFTVEYEGKKVLGKVLDKRRAAETYDDAIASGQGACLVENKESENLFTLSVGNLPPKKQIVVELHFIMETKSIQNLKESTLRLGRELFPLLSSADFEFSCKVFNSACIRQVTVTGFLTNCEKVCDGDETNMVVLCHIFSKKDLSNDIIITIETISEEPTASLEINDDGSYTAQLTFAPVLEEAELDAPRNYEFIFVVDRSGSMSGTRIACTIVALKLLLHSLSPGSTFNILSFGTHCEWMLPKPQEYSQKSLEEAKLYVDRMGADMGGTNLKTPLEEVFLLPKDISRPRIVLVLTDGDIYNKNEVLALVKRSIGTGRLYALGIEDANVELIGGLAMAGNGAEYFCEGWNVDDTVIQMFQEINQPLLRNLHVDWRKTGTRVPSVMPNSVEYNVRHTFYSILGEVPESVAIEVGDPMIHKEMPFKVTTRGNLLRRIAGLKLIRELEEGTSGYHISATGKILTPDPKMVEDRITNLGIKYQLATKYTSFIAVVEESEAVSGSMQECEVVRSGPESYLRNSVVGVGGQAKIIQAKQEAIEMAEKATEQAKRLRQGEERREQEVAVRKRQIVEEAKRLQEEENLRSKEREVRRAPLVANDGEGSSDEAIRRMKERIERAKQERAEKKAREEAESMCKYAQEESAAKDAARLMQERIAARKRELSEKKAQEEAEAMCKYAQEESAANDAARLMQERIAARKRELSEKKARAEEEAMAKYMEEEKAADSAAAQMRERIAIRKHELGDNKARQEAEAMACYCAEEQAAQEASRLISERIAATMARGRVLERKPQVQPPVSPAQQETKLYLVQKFDGGWDEDKILVELMKTPVEDIKTQKPQDIPYEIWLAILGIALLRTKYHVEQTKWVAIAKKAQLFAVNGLMSAKGLDRKSALNEVTQLVEAAVTWVKSLC